MGSYSHARFAVWSAGQGRSNALHLHICAYSHELLGHDVHEVVNGAWAQSLVW